MKEGYSKKQLVKLLELTIKATRAGAGVKALTLDGDYVIIHYTGGTKKVNIACDSGIAIVMDVAKRI